MDGYDLKLREALVDPVTGEPRFRIKLVDEALLTPEIKAWLSKVERAVADEILRDSKKPAGNVFRFPPRDS